MRLDERGFHCAQIRALGVLGARAALDVIKSALWEDLLSFDFKLRGVDDAQALDLFAALVGDQLVARLDVGARVSVGEFLRERGAQRRLRPRRRPCR